MDGHDACWLARKLLAHEPKASIKKNFCRVVGEKSSSRYSHEIFITCVVRSYCRSTVCNSGRFSIGGHTKEVARTLRSTAAVKVIFSGDFLVLKGTSICRNHKQYIDERLELGKEPKTS